jgi:hypothetical protein
MVRGLLLAAGVVSMADASAQSRWMYSLSVPAELEYDSNPSMSPGDSAGSTFWLRLTPSLVTKYVLGNEEFTLETALSAEKSSNQRAAQDRLDPRLRAAWKHVDPLNTTEVAALLERSAFRDLDVRRQVPLGADASRTLFALTGNWTRDIDARTAFNADVRQEWERSTGTVSPDFQRTTAAGRIKRAHDERTSWYVGLNGQDYRPEDAPGPAGAPAGALRSTVAGALVGLERAFSEALRFDVSAGPVRFTRPQSRNDWQAAATVEYTMPRWQAGVDVLRAPGVNSTGGGLVVTEELRMRVRYDLDPRSRLEVDAGAAREKAAGSNRTLASISWVRQLDPAWQVAVKGSTQRQEGPGGVARSNRIGVMLVYSAPDL